MPEEALGGLFVALASVQFGLVVVLGKVASNRGVPLESLLAIRFGIAFALASATAFALYLLGMERTMKRTSSVVASTWISASAAAAIALYALASGKAALPHGGHQWWPVIGTGVFTSGAFFALFAGL